MWSSTTAPGKSSGTTRPTSATTVACVAPRFRTQRVQVSGKRSQSSRSRSYAEPMSDARDSPHSAGAQTQPDTQQRLLEASRIGRRAPSTQKWLLRDIRLHVDAGARLAIAGPSGSGKSLLLRALALLDPLDEGAIT